MAQAVSINRSKKFEDLVQAFSGENAVFFDESGKKLFPTIREFLTFAALLGIQKTSRVPLDRSMGIENIQGVTYENTEALEFNWLVGVIETGSVDILKDGNEKECATIFEEYANGGLEIISGWLESDTQSPNFDILFNEISSILD